MQEQFFGPSRFYGLNHPSAAYPNYSLQLEEGKGKGKSREIDFETAFAQVTASLSQTRTSSDVRERINDTTSSLEEQFRKTSLGDLTEEDNAELR